MQHPPRTSSFRAEISALRAVAVLLVVLFHLWPGRLPGGFVGVDVFFVISGFLITHHLVREADRTGTVSLAQFWARRARRLLPAAYLVLAVTAIAVAIWMPMMTWVQNFRQIVASTLYVQNWALAADSVDYLAADEAPSAVQHYWTLSVEEQFYIVWPLLVLAAIVLARRRSWSAHRTLTVVLGVTTAASFVLSLWMTQSNPPAAYFVTPVRAWQFGAGALLALWFTRGARSSMDPVQTPVNDTVRSLITWSGFAILAYCGLWFDGSTPFPGTAALLPVGATVAIIWAGEPVGRLSPAPLMRLRPVRFLGDISYSMYLWHWPPIVIAPIALGRDLGLVDRVIVLVATIVAAWATQRWVEDPIRFTSRFGLKRPSVTGLVTLVAASTIVATTLVGHQSAKTAQQAATAAAAALVEDAPPCFGAAAMDPDNSCSNPDLDGTLVPSTAAASEDYPKNEGCFTEPADTQLNDCTFGDVTDRSIPHVILLGDSHARAMLPALVAMAEQKRISVSAQLKSSCAWSRDEIKYPDPMRVSTCQAWKAKLEPWLVKQAPTTDLIVTTGYTKLNAGSNAEQDASMRAAWQPIIDRGVPIVALKDNPRHDEAPNKCLARLDAVTDDSCATPRDRAFIYHDAFAATGSSTPGAQTLDMTRYYCTEDVCPAVMGGVNVYRDNSHFTVTYVKTLAPFLYRELVAMNALPPPSGGRLPGSCRCR